jgi:UrcA family protein
VKFTHSNDAASAPKRPHGTYFTRYQTAPREAHIGAVDNSPESPPHIHLEIEMNTQLLNAKSLFSIAVVAVCVALSGTVQAESHEVTVKIAVSAAGLDLNKPAGARELYSRLRQAARTACRDGDRVGLEPAENFVGCYEQALGESIRVANLPQLTLVYLQTHTSEDAATRGIVVPTLVAAK